ncbi:DUF2851 family protein [uncultured Polaribacter sp.]|uniref:DUF2851 family protein n=1 Tax=uncultured Polaribacter sp. TaxID=174711 RepID=UPI002623F441|nr:DUF2851 family protein [uncultured Polaribacter sp.]
MNEDFLHYVWKYKIFSSVKLCTINNETLSILKTGLHNQNAGPDFLNAQIKIDDQTWVGNVEIHLKSSDWYMHNHEVDTNYDAVILHVVWENDALIYMKNNKAIPTLVLKPFVDKNLLKNYKNLFFSPKNWIPCEKSFTQVDYFTFNNWKERLFFERLERKSSEIKILLELEQNNFEAVLFQLLAKNFGLKINGDAFLALAKSIDFSVVKKVSSNSTQFSALLFGQAGFLEEGIQHNYYMLLKEEYGFIKHKFKLKPMLNNQFSFFRMRPNNFPTIRIAQLVALFSKEKNLFSKIIESNKLKDFYDLFKIEINDFWQTHYNFESVSKKSPKRLTKSFIDLLIINTIIPLKFMYHKGRGEVNEETYLEILREIKSEKNSIISKFTELKVSSENAFDSQALLELKNNYCALKRCLECAIGKNVLSKS